jgi:nucleoside-diphosphate-sugar epimerase
MSSLVILGASGFLGRALISAVPRPLPVKAVARHIPPDAELQQVQQEGITWIEADLVISASLYDVLHPGDIVVNLAYMPFGGEAGNETMINNIVEACLSRRVARLVHCSTAVVAGVVTQSRILESTPCLPRLPYERIKWTLEQKVLSAVPKGLDVGILRPTAIVGTGSRNLVKLARSLLHGNRIVSYLRASVFARRPMHLVPVRDVVLALLHLANLPVPLNGNIYHVSSDEDPDNNFRTIEQVLSRALGLPSRRLPLLPVPPQLLALLLRALGRSETNLGRVYDSRKLLNTGFRPVDSVLRAVRDFGERYRDDDASCSSNPPLGRYR